ncbi:MAG: CoA-binding protein [Pseudomonadota bacterium]
MDHETYPDSYIAGILNAVKTIAMIGASTKDVRPSYIAMKYLLAKGYDVAPINPGHAGEQILGQTVYARLADIPHRIDMVDIFRGSHAVPKIVDEILALENLPDVIWMQLTIRNDAAAKMAEAAGIKVVMNRCPKIEYGRLSGEISWNGVNRRVVSARKPVRLKGYQSLGIRVRPD